MKPDASALQIIDEEIELLVKRVRHHRFKAARTALIRGERCDGADRVAEWAEVRLARLREARSEIFQLYQRSLEGARFMDGMGRNDRAEPLREAAHRVLPPLATMERVEAAA